MATAADADAAYEEHRRRMANSSRIYLDRRQRGALFGKFKTGGAGYCLKKSMLLKKLNANKGRLANYVKRIAGRDVRPELNADIDGKLSVSQFCDLLEYTKTPKVPATEKPESQKAPQAKPEITRKTVSQHQPKTSSQQEPAKDDDDDKAAIKEAKVLVAMQALLPAAVSAVATSKVKQKPLTGSMDKLELSLCLAELRTILPYLKRPFNRRIVAGGIQQLSSAITLHDSNAPAESTATVSSSDAQPSGQTAAEEEASNQGTATLGSTGSEPAGQVAKKKKKVPWESRAVRRAKKAAAAAAAAAEAAEAAEADSSPEADVPVERVAETTGEPMVSPIADSASAKAVVADQFVDVVDPPTTVNAGEDNAKPTKSTTQAGTLPPNETADNTQSSSSQPEQFYCCRMCRAPLFKETAVSHGGEPDAKCDSWFLQEPQSWMPLTSDGGQQEVRWVGLQESKLISA